MQGGGSRHEGGLRAGNLKICFKEGEEGNTYTVKFSTLLGGPNCGIFSHNNQNKLLQKKKDEQAQEAHEPGREEGVHHGYILLQW
jgi:hypothetical protein